MDYIDILAKFMEGHYQLFIEPPTKIYLDDRAFEYVARSSWNYLSPADFDPRTLKEFSLLGITFVREHVHKYKCKCGSEISGNNK